jgi:endonuclease/exonuclease/phosphatase (EEP) superfamily protein YafD
MFIKFRTSIKALFPISLITLQLIISIILITPFQIAPKPLQNSDIYFMNTNVYNENYTEILEYIKKYNPQKVALVEVRIEIIDKIKENYGEPVTYINGGAYSCAIFSREKPIKTEPIQVETYPICKAVFEDYTLLVIHPYPPLTHESYSSQKEYFSQIQNELEHLRQNGENFVLVGDFNSTIYSGVFRKYFGEYHNVNHYTWNPKSPLALPIDHGLSNLPIETSKGDKLSSDHTGLFIKLLD